VFYSSSESVASSSNGTVSAVYLVIVFVRRGHVVILVNFVTFHSAQYLVDICARRFTHAMESDVRLVVVQVELQPWLMTDVRTTLRCSGTSVP